MRRSHGGSFTATVPGGPGTRYGLRADGPFAPDRGHRFDPAKLLVDPYATRLDRPFAYAPALAERGADTAGLMPKAIAEDLPPPAAAPPPLFRPGGLIYELPVRPFTIRHPDIPEEIRGTVAALAHPAILEHLTRLRVDAVELMPIAAWIDERHLAPLGLTNGWGYNPVAFMAPDPRLCPGGLPELAATVAALRDAGIGTILDVVFNHTGEGDAFGPTLSLRGLDNAAYFRHEPDGRLVNDAGTGNTLACDHPATRRLILDALAPLRRPRRRRRLPLRPRPGPRPLRRRRLRSERQPSRGDGRRPSARRPRHDRRALGHRPRRLPARPLPPDLARMERPLPRPRPPLLARRPAPARRVRHRARRLLRQSSRRRHPNRQLHRRPRRLHPRRPRRLPPQAQRRQRRGEPRRPRREPLLEQRRRRPDRRPRRHRRAPPRPEGAARHALRLARHDHADRRRRVRPHARPATTTPTPRTTPSPGSTGRAATASSRRTPRRSPRCAAPTRRWQTRGC